MFLKQHKKAGINMEKNSSDNERGYTESLFYEVSLTGKYIKKLGEQHFKNLNLDFTIEEFSTLDFIFYGKNVCQRDLAIKTFINRANMGKILNGLEEKGYIKRTVDIKCNRPIKLVSMTEAGRAAYLKTVETLRKTASVIMDKFTEEESKFMIERLHKMRNLLKEVVEINI